MANSDDEMYIAAFKKRDKIGIKGFYNEMKEGSMKLMNKMNVPDEDRNELFHDAVIQTIDNINLGKFENKSTLKTYCSAILKYKCLDYFKTNKRTESIDDVNPLVLTENEYTFEPVNSNELNLMKEGLRKLDDNCRKLLLDFYYGKQ